MTLIIGLIVAALAAMLVAVATTARPLVCCPAAGVAAGILLPLGLELAVAGDHLIAMAATVPGLVAGGWGLAIAFQDAERRRVAGGAR